MLHRLAHRLLGDGVEDDALDRLVLQRALFLEHFQDMPGDRFALAVGVGRKNEGVGAFDGACDVVEALLRLGVDLPDHSEVGLGVDGPILGRKISDMTKRGQDLIARPKIFVDGLGLGRRFDDDNLHVIPMT